uniref:Tail tubular protein B n=1 Tax=uncultured marine virus TaxID=186617 RepID=A0A0F7L8M4_9VIRU|nr:hypothetical protein TMO_0047 [uncultured marine virus]
MARLRPAKTNITRGELDPQALMRHDTVAYENGVEKARNVLIFPQGGARRRDGLEYIDEIPPVAGVGTPGAFTNIKMIEFKFSITQLYVIYFITDFFYIYRNDALVFEGSHTYTDAEIPQLNWDQNLDTLFLFHEDHEQATLVRNGSDSSWTLANFTLTDVPTVVFDNAVTGIGTPSAVGTPGGTVTFTTVDNNFVVGDVGKFIRGNDGYGEITTYTSATQVTLTLVSIFADANAIPDGLWTLEEVAYSVARGWPVSGTIFQGRLCLAGCKALPDFFAASRSGLIKNFANTNADDDSAIVAFSDAPGISTFLNIYGGRHLQVFSGDAEYYIPISENDPITPSNVILRRNSSVGAKGSESDDTRINIKPEEVDGVVYFVQKGGGAIREFVFDDAQLAYKADTVNIVSSHLIRTPKDMALRKSQSTTEPNYLWVVNGDDGSLATFCVLKSELVNAWTLCTTQGTFEGATVLDADSYFAVKRTINSATVWTLEKFNKDLLFDGAKTATGAVSSVSNLDWLEGEEVGLILDGSYMGLVTVTSGVATFPRASVTDYQLGLPFPDVDEADDPEPSGAGNNVLIKPLPDDFAVPGGTTMGKRKRVVNVALRVYQTKGFYINNKLVPIRALGGDLLDETVPSLTKDVKIKSIPGWTERGQFTISQREPQPMTILGFGYDLAV